MTSKEAGIQKAKFNLESIVPLIMHNSTTADPLNPISLEMKKVSHKRDKTERDHRDLARMEWKAGLYLDGTNLVLPSRVVEAALSQAAKKRKLGKQFAAAVIVEGNTPLKVEGWTNDLDKNFDSGKFLLALGVKVQGRTVIRTRPYFEHWTCTVTVSYLSDLVNLEDIATAFETCGQQVGFCDWRPKYGRFQVIG